MDANMHDGTDMDVDMDMDMEQQQGHERAGLELPVCTVVRSSSPASLPPAPLILLSATGVSVWLFFFDGTSLPQLTRR
jgi:hypothetical protein